MCCLSHRLIDKVGLSSREVNVFPGVILWDESSRTRLEAESQVPGLVLFHGSYGHQPQHWFSNWMAMLRSPGKF